MNTKACPSRFDAYENALPNEPIFTLRAADPQASGLVRDWAEGRRISRPDDKERIASASAIALAMDEWREHPNHKNYTDGAARPGQLPYLSPSDPGEASLLRTACLRLTAACYGAAYAAGWWNDPKTSLRKERNIGEALMLIVSELAEAMEGHRKNLDDDKLPQFKMIEVELADALIRIFDLAGGQGYRVADALVAKLAFNAVRPDHKLEARSAPGGKAY